jgi:cell division protein ZipA
MLLGSELAIAWNPWVGIPLLIVGVIVLVLVWLFGEPKKEQGKRRVVAEPGVERERREPTFGGSADESDSFRDTSGDDRLDPLFTEPSPQQGELDVGLRMELEKLGATLADERHAAHMPKPTGHAASIVEALRSPSQPISPSESLTKSVVVAQPGSTDVHQRPVATTAPEPASVPAPPAPPAPRIPPRSDLGKRPAQMPVERIVSLFVVAREGHYFNGADLIVAAEKAGLEYGDMGIYHRLVDGKRELGPIFSVANMLKPGSFDLTRLDALRTLGLSFFMALPGPVTALDAWDAMLPTAQRLAELLDGQVLDEERNALGRQRIAHIRDELRGWDRDHDGGEIRFGR